MVGTEVIGATGTGGGASARVVAPAGLVSRADAETDGTAESEGIDAAPGAREGVGAGSAGLLAGSIGFVGEMGALAVVAGALTDAIGVLGAEGGTPAVGAGALAGGTELDALLAGACPAGFVGALVSTLGAAVGAGEVTFAGAAAGVFAAGGGSGGAGVAGTTSGGGGTAAGTGGVMAAGAGGGGVTGAGVTMLAGGVAGAIVAGGGCEMGAGGGTLASGVCGAAGAFAVASASAGEEGGAAGAEDVFTAGIVTGGTTGALSTSPEGVEDGSPTPEAAGLSLASSAGLASADLVGKKIRGRQKAFAGTSGAAPTVFGAGAGTAGGGVVAVGTVADSPAFATAGAAVVAGGAAFGGSPATGEMAIRSEPVGPEPLEVFGFFTSSVESETFLPELGSIGAEGVLTTGSTFPATGSMAAPRPLDSDDDPAAGLSMGIRSDLAAGGTASPGEVAPVFDPGATFNVEASGAT